MYERLLTVEDFVRDVLEEVAVAVREVDQEPGTLARLRQLLKPDSKQTEACRTAFRTLVQCLDRRGCEPQAEHVV